MTEPTDVCARCVEVGGLCARCRRTVLPQRAVPSWHRLAHSGRWTAAHAAAEKDAATKKAERREARKLARRRQVRRGPLALLDAINAVKMPTPPPTPQADAA